MGTFYCGSCGYHKDDSLKRNRAHGRTPICCTCKDKQEKIFFGTITQQKRREANNKLAQQKYLNGTMYIRNDA